MKESGSVRKELCCRVPATGAWVVLCASVFLHPADRSLGAQVVASDRLSAVGPDGSPRDRYLPDAGLPDPDRPDADVSDPDRPVAGPSDAGLPDPEFAELAESAEPAPSREDADSESREGARGRRSERIRVVFSPPSAHYDGSVVVTLETNGSSEVEIRYTTNGETPTLESDLYQTPLVPGGNTVLRAAGFLGGRRVTPVATGSYFLEADFEVPVLSIVMKPEDYRTVHESGEARGKGSERPALLQVFEDGELVASAGCGLRLHGGASRSGDFETKKSYRCYFRRSYGDRELRYSIIPDTFVDRFKRLVLRAGFNDSFRGSPRAVYLRDQLIRDLHEDMGMLVSHGAWLHLFVNMKWRGVFNVVERLDEHFLRSYTGQDEWDVIKTGCEVQEGDATEWTRLHDFLARSDLADDRLYRAASRMIDLENFTSYMLVNIWAQNHDWPHNNWYAARPRRPDGKWSFLCWDGEFGIGLIPEGHDADTFEFIFSREGYLRDILESLLANAGYREYFVQEADRHRFGALSAGRALAHLRRLRDLVEADMDREAEIFGMDDSEWRKNLRECETFVRFRGKYFYESIAMSERFEFPRVTTPRILRVDRTSVLNTGEQTLTVSGARLTSRTQFYLGGVRALRARRRVGAQVRLKVPFDLSLEGAVSLTAVNPKTGESSEAPELLTVRFPRPAPARIEPRGGSAGGGERVRIKGTGFRPGVQVWFGGTPALQVDLLESAGDDEVLQTLDVVTPPGRGKTPIFVVNQVAGGALPARSTSFFEFREEGFIRGDVDGDGDVGMSDALRLLTLLARGGAFECASAADSDDSGIVGIADGMYLLAFLFDASSAPLAPFPICGEDATPDALSCGGRSVCTG